MNMRKQTLAALLALALLLPGCAPAEERENPRLSVVCTTYPIYLFVSSIAQGVEGVAVERLDTGSASCLHDYSLSMSDMKKLERADVIAMNGAGLEEFLEDALETSDAAVIDCSEGIELLENLSHHHDEDDHDLDGHDHGHWDPHYWMDPQRAVQMVRTLRDGLTALDSAHAQQFADNTAAALEVLDIQNQGAAREAAAVLATGHTALDSICRHQELITFHDGFQYFAQAFGLELLASIEEEAGSEASAHEIVDITQLVREYDIPAIFTEVNGSDATAQAIRRETGCGVYQLDMAMSGEGTGVQDYQNVIIKNLQTIAEALK